MSSVITLANSDLHSRNSQTVEDQISEVDRTWVVAVDAEGVDPSVHQPKNLVANLGRVGQDRSRFGPGHEAALGRVTTIGKPFGDEGKIERIRQAFDLAAGQPQNRQPAFGHGKHQRPGNIDLFLCLIIKGAVGFDEANVHSGSDGQLFEPDDLSLDQKAKIAKRHGPVDPSKVFAIIIARVCADDDAPLFGPGERLKDRLGVARVGSATD